MAKIPRIGYLATSRAANPYQNEALLQGLRDLGYIEGRTLWSRPDMPTAGLSPALCILGDGERASAQEDLGDRGPEQEELELGPCPHAGPLGGVDDDGSQEEPRVELDKEYRARHHDGIGQRGPACPEADDQGRPAEPVSKHHVPHEHLR